MDHHNHDDKDDPHQMSKQQQQQELDDECRVCFTTTIQNLCQEARTIWLSTTSKSTTTKDGTCSGLILLDSKQKQQKIEELYRTAWKLVNETKQMTKMEKNSISTESQFVVVSQSMSSVHKKDVNTFIMNEHEDENDVTVVTDDKNKKRILKKEEQLLCTADADDEYHKKRKISMNDSTTIIKDENHTVGGCTTLPTTSSSSTSTTNPVPKQTMNGNVQINHHHNDNTSNNNKNLESYRSMVGEKFALFLLQTNRSLEADQILIQLGYKCRLTSKLFQYKYQHMMMIQQSEKSKTIPTKIIIKQQQPSTISGRRHHPVVTQLTPPPPCQIYRNYYTNHEIQLLRKVFYKPNNHYWIDHHYQIEPPSPYFSYLIPIQRNNNNNNKDPEKDDDFGSIGKLVQRLHQFLVYQSKTKDKHKKLTYLQSIASSTYCEMWAHNRPYPTGHQFHFDSDNEGKKETKKNNNNVNNNQEEEEYQIRNPICSVVIYLNKNNTIIPTTSNDDNDNNIIKKNAVGAGPTVITNQRLLSQQLADQCWLCYPTSIIKKPSSPTQAGDNHSDDDDDDEMNKNQNSHNNNNHNKNNCNHTNNVMMCVFDGKVLHGVIPGKPPLLPPQDSSISANSSTTSSNVEQNNLRRLEKKDPKSINVTTSTTTTTKKIVQQQQQDQKEEEDDLEDRRVTVMFAFWKRIRVRTSDDHHEFGAARILPTQPLWARELRENQQQQEIHKQTTPTTKVDRGMTTTNATAVGGTCSGPSNQSSNVDDKDNDDKHCSVEEMVPIHLDRVYEVIGGTSTGQKWNTRTMGFPAYDEIFQGF